MIHKTKTDHIDINSCIPPPLKIPRRLWPLTWASLGFKARPGRSREMCTQKLRNKPNSLRHVIGKKYSSHREGKPSQLTNVFTLPCMCRVTKQGGRCQGQGLPKVVNLWMESGWAALPNKLESNSVEEQPRQHHWQTFLDGTLHSNTQSADSTQQDACSHGRRPDVPQVANVMPSSERWNPCDIKQRKPSVRRCSKGTASGWCTPVYLQTWPWLSHVCQIHWSLMLLSDENSHSNEVSWWNTQASGNNDSGNYKSMLTSSLVSCRTVSPLKWPN